METRPSFPELISKTVARVRARGPREVFDTWRAMVRELLASDEKLIMLYRDLKTAGPAPAAPSGTTFREAGPDDAMQYARDVGTDSMKTFSARLSSRTKCFFVMDDTTVLHASWVTTAAAWTREVQRYFCPPAGDAYIYESFTRSDARGRGIFPFALESICRLLAAGGIRRVWIGVEDGNEPSRRAITKAGFEPGFAIMYRRRLGRLTVGAPEGPGARPDHGFLSTSPECRPA
jgi:GNAT superfamily N-acetyltransferase